MLLHSMIAVLIQFILRSVFNWGLAWQIDLPVYAL